MIRASKIFDKGIKNLYDKIVCEKVFFFDDKDEKSCKRLCITRYYELYCE